MDDRQPMLSLHDGRSYRNWVLLASYKDGSMLRDMMEFCLGRVLSKDCTSDCQPVSATVNDTDFDVCLPAKQQGIRKGRIDITEDRTAGQRTSSEDSRLRCSMVMNTSPKATMRLSLRWRITSSGGTNRESRPN